MLEPLFIEKQLEYAEKIVLWFEWKKTLGRRFSIEQLNKNAFLLYGFRIIRKEQGYGVRQLLDPFGNLVSTAYDETAIWKNPRLHSWHSDHDLYVKWFPVLCNSYSVEASYLVSINVQLEGSSSKLVIIRRLSCGHKAYEVELNDKMKIAPASLYLSAKMITDRLKELK